MYLSSLNVDVVLYLIKFINPEDRFNLVLSGTLKGFENVNEGIDIRQRIKRFAIELGLRRNSTCQLEIRSFIDRSSYHELKDESRLIILDRLADGGYFQNNRQLILSSWWSSISRLFQVISYMTHLEKISLLHWKLKLTLTEDLLQMFRSCPKLTELHLQLVERRKLEMGEELKNELRSGFQRLQLFELHWYIDSWPAIQEILSWLKECVQLSVRNCNYTWSALVIDHSWRLNPDFSQNLQFLHLCGFPVEFVKWVLPFCSNIHALKLSFNDQPKDLHSEIVRLKKLKNLHIETDIGIHPKEIIRNCRQVEILRVDATKFNQIDLAGLEHNDNITEVHLRWLLGPSVKEVLPMLKRCTHLRRLTLERPARICFPPFEELCNFIMELKQLTCLQIIYDHCHRSNHFKSEVDEVNAFLLPLRPNFNFCLSCCSKSGKSRVSRTTTL